MEMRCPDDIGRDSWDWVGPPAWVRACFNSSEWGGGSSPVKTEPHQIVLLLLLLWLFQTLLDDCVWPHDIGVAMSPRTDSHVAEHLEVRLRASPPPLSPRRRRTLRRRGLPKKSAESRDSTSKWTESEKRR